MTEPGSTADDGDPTGVKVPWDQKKREAVLAEWIGTEGATHTDAALEAAAVTAGYTPEEFKAAMTLHLRRTVEAPIKTTARLWIVVAYVVVWGLFAIVFLTRPSTYGAGVVAQIILTITLGIGLALSLVIIRLGHPDPERRSRALVLILAFPVVMLLGVAGLCLPFTTVT